MRVPKGRVTTYGELARAAGTHPRTVAVYMKTNKDPAGIQCYRVVSSDGSLGGYSGPGGVKKKLMLLREDGVPVKNGRIDLERCLHRF